MSAEGIGNQLKSTTSIRVYASYNNLNIYFISERIVASLMLVMSENFLMSERIVESLIQMEIPGKIWL